MITAEQVPKEAAAWLNAYGLNEYTAQVAIAAAINAWPGMYDEKDTPWSKASTIHLPLPQESGNE